MTEVLQHGYINFAGRNQGGGSGGALRFGVGRIGVDVLGNYQWDPTYTGANDDISTYIKSWSVVRGRDKPLDAIQQGRCNVTLHDKLRRFDRTNTASPLYGQMRPGLPFKLVIDVPNVDNFMANYDFETNLTGWSTSGGTLSRITATDALRGGSYARFVATAANQFVYGTTSASGGAGKIVTAIAWVKGTGTWNVRIWDGAAASADTTIGLSSAWQKVEITYTLSGGAGATAQLRFVATGAGTIEIDWARYYFDTGILSPYTIFEGWLSAGNTNPDLGEKETFLQAGDLLGILSREEATIAPLTNINGGQAFGAILDAIEWKNPAKRYLDTGDAIPIFDPDPSQKLKEIADRVLDAQRGAFYHTREGVARYQSRNYWAQQIAPLLLRELDVATPLPGWAEEGIVNFIRVKNERTETEQTYRDDPSYAAYGLQPGPDIASKYFESDAQAFTNAKSVVDLKKEPEDPIHKASLMEGPLGYSKIMAMVDIGDWVWLSPELGLGITGDYTVERIELSGGGGTTLKGTFGLKKRPQTSAGIPPLRIGVGQIGVNSLGV